MGTIGNQPERPDRVLDALRRLEHAARDMQTLAKRLDMSVSDLIALRKAMSNEALVDTLRDDGDFRDEHAGGYNETLTRIADALHELALCANGFANKHKAFPSL